MNRITISLIFLTMISMFLPTLAIMYASGQSSDNSDSSSSGSTSSDNNAADSGSSSGGSGGSTTTDNSGSSTTGSTDNSHSSSSGGSTTDNSRSSSSGGSTTTTDNSATLPTTSTASNNTGTVKGVDVNGILAVHNQERAAVGVPSLTWSNTLAAGAQTWADQLLATGKVEHSTCCGAFRDYGEMISLSAPDSKTPGLAELWVSEKKNYHGGPITEANGGSISHYTQMVWKTTKEVGCGFASGPGGVFAKSGGTGILVCRYDPPGNTFGQNPY
jgi:uncharacterized protein YkwD